MCLKGALRLLIPLIFGICGLLVPQHGQACACCTNPGQRAVHADRLEPGGSRYVQLADLRFAKPARLALGEADLESVVGIAAPSEHYEIAATLHPDRWLFTFRDKAGHSGTLALMLPKTISIFEVDPRDEPDRGHGPSLYKEWTLMSKATGTGIFRAGARRGARTTLVIHGRGNSCTSSIDFSHWTLMVDGPRAQYKLIGELLRDVGK